MRRRALLVLPVAVAGCVVGPEPRRPGLPVEPEAAYVNAPADTPAEGDLDGWWRRFDDEETERLVVAALDGNLDIDASAASVLEARALLDLAVGRRFPLVTADFDVTRLSRPIDLPVGRGKVLTSSHDLTGGVSWQLDLFGKLRRAQQASAARLVAAEADRYATLHTVVAEVVRTRVTLATLALQLRLARENVDSLAETLRIVEAFYEGGGGRTSALDVRLARQNLAAAEAQVPAIDRQLEQAKLALAVLLGRRPGTLETDVAGLAGLPPLAPPPLGVPGALLDRRPDLVASEFRTLAAQADIGVEVADLFPSLSVSVSGGYSSTALHELIDPTSEVWSVGANLGQLLFDGGASVAEIEATRARAQREASLYAGLVLRALQEVEAALVAERQSRLELAALEVALAEAEAAETLARDRYERGLEDLLNVFEAERRRRSSEVSLADARSAVWLARVDLHLAIGGDWGLPAGEVERDDVLEGPAAEAGWPSLDPGIVSPPPPAPESFTRDD